MPVSVCILVVCQNCQDHFLFQTGLYTLSPFNLPILCQPCQLVMDPCAWLFLWFCFRWSCSPPMIQLAQMHYHGPWLTASTAPNIWGAKSLWRRDSWHLLTTQDIMIMSQTKDQAFKYQQNYEGINILKTETFYLSLWHWALRIVLQSRPLNASVVREARFPFGVETKIAGGTGSHLIGPGRAGCKLLVKTYGNPSSRAACNGCLDGDGLGEFGYHPQALWLLKQTQEMQKNVRHDSQIKKCTVELFKRTIDLLESCKHLPRPWRVWPGCPRVAPCSSWIPRRSDCFQHFETPGAAVSFSFVQPKRVASCQVDPGGPVEKVSWKNPKKMDSFNSLTYSRFHHPANTELLPKVMVDVDSEGQVVVSME